MGCGLNNVYQDNLTLNREEQHMYVYAHVCMQAERMTYSTWVNISTSNFNTASKVKCKQLDCDYII